MNMGRIRISVTLLLATLAPGSILAQSDAPALAPMMCAKDYLWDISTRFDERKLEDAKAFCKGRWDCFGNEAGNPDIQICLDGKCTDIDEERTTTRKCRDSVTCSISRKRIGAAQISIVVKDDDAVRDDELTATVFALKRPANMRADRVKVAYSTDYVNASIDYERFFRSDYGKALIFMEPSLGWTQCPSYDPLARVINGVDITKLINDQTCSALIYNRELGQAQSSLSRGFGASGTAAGSAILGLANLGLFELQAEAYTDVFSKPPAQWSNLTWASVIDKIDELPQPEKYESRAVGGMVQELKGCLKP